MVSQLDSYDAQLKSHAVGLSEQFRFFCKCVITKSALSHAVVIVPEGAGKGLYVKICFSKTSERLREIPEQVTKLETLTTLFFLASYQFQSHGSPH